MTVTQTLSNSLYRLDSQLGSGGGGVVYKAWHTRLEKYVVIKELKRGTKDSVETQRNEVEALKNVKSAYLPQVLDFFTEGDRVFTVMEFIDGVSFDKLIGQGERFAEAQVVKWYGQLAAALEVIHGANIAHRDIKPANIMLQPNGDVCLIDFNAALVDGNDVQLISRSLGYASPEQYEIYERYKNMANAPIQYIASGSSTFAPNNSDLGTFKYTETAIMANSADGTGDTTELMEKNISVGEYQSAEGQQSSPFLGYNQATGRNSASAIGNSQFVSNQNIDWMLSDIYSLGATIYHLLSGIRPPAKAEELKGISQAGQYDDGLAYIIESSMRLDPAGRIPSAAALSKAIQDIYKYNSRYKALTVKQIAAAVILPLMFSGFLVTSVLGYNKIGQEKEERFYSAIYEVENGDNFESAYLEALEIFEDRIDPYYAMTRRLWESGDLENCGEYIRENLGQLAKFQNDESSFEALGGIYYILGDCYYYCVEGRDYQNAKVNYEMSVRFAPKNGGYCRDYAITLARLGDIEGAKAELERAKGLELDEISLSLLRGEIDLADGKLDSALNYFKEVIKIAEDDYIRYRAYHSADEIYKIDGDFENSAKLLADSLDKIPLNRVSEMKERLADSYYRRGDNEKAVVIFEELVQSNPSFNLRQNLAILYQSENEFERASGLLKTMRADFPADYRVPMRQAFLEIDVQGHKENESRDYLAAAMYYYEAQGLYEKKVKPGENDPEMEQLENIIEQLKEGGWIE